MRKDVTISDLGIIVTGHTPPRSQPQLYGSHTPFIKATDISETEKYTYHPEEGYSEEGYKKYIKSLIPKGSTCVVTIGSIGKKMTMAHCDIFINQAMNAIIPNENYNNEYVYYVIRNILPNIKSLDSGTASGRENVSKAAFSKMEITVEDNIETQRRIASILSRYDDLIENYQHQIQLLEEAAQRLYKEWFVDLHFPGYENTNIVDGVPEGWEKKNIEDLCLTIKAGGTPSRRKDNYWVPGTIKWVKTKELQDNWILDTEEYISEDGLNNSSTKLFPKNTILMAIYASPTLGRLGILNCESTCNQAALGLIANESIISYQWLYYKLFELREHFNAVARGAGQQNISSDVVKKKEIVCPPKKIIDMFTDIVNPIFRKSLAITSQIRLLTEARDRLLPKLMSGEITV